ncbi:hypothetical protein [Bacillus sonorensis]|uniref:hypothetical protein n=1 Tax=Bacillus sonorensis TaxID=119858 RepID=UPI0022E0BFCE|nr:hypothetical protein [Bacillus sonorensis]
MDFVRVEVERRRMTPKRWIPRLFMFFAGFVLLLISLILMITIIGILPGLGLGSLSVFLIFGAFFGGERFECPRCGFKNNFVTYGKHNETCRKCKQNIAIDWIKYNKGEKVNLN